MRKLQHRKYRKVLQPVENCIRSKIDIIQAILSSILLNNRIIVIENRQKNFQLQLQLLTFENVQLQLQQNRVINCNFVNYNYNFSMPAKDAVLSLPTHFWPR